MVLAAFLGLQVKYVERFTHILVSARGIFRAVFVHVVSHVKDANLREHPRATFSFGRVWWKTFNARTYLKVCYPDLRCVLKLGPESLQDADRPIGSDRFWDIDFEMQPSIISC